MRGKTSRWKYLNDGLAQGSVLSPKLFNLYTGDMPNTVSRKILYADDKALVHEAPTFEELEYTLSDDLETMSKYYKDWRLIPNPAKSEVSVFHLNNREAARQLNVTFNGTTLNHNPNPIYLGVKLDRTLTYKEHLSSVSKKLAARVNIIQKLAGTGWGASAKALKTATQALVYAPAEYVCAAWKNSAHVHKVDVQLNQAMRVISGTLKSTNLKWLPVLANIVPPKIRREVAAKKIFCKFKNNENSLLHQQLIDPPRTRLKSRKPIFFEMNELPLDARQLWRNDWMADPPPNGHLIDDPSEITPGFDLPRKQWTTINRFRTGHGRCSHLMHKWRFKDSPSCSCGCPEQTMAHIVNDCPDRKFPGGLNLLHECNTDAVNWISQLDIDL